MDVADFDAAFPQLLEDCLPPDIDSELSVAREWLKKVLEYNVPHGKKNRSLIIASSYRHLLGSDRPLTGDEVHKLQVLGWCVEMVHVRSLCRTEVKYFSL
jgi:farnesyl diphosphate synthase